MSEGYYGFVYITTNHVNGKRYIGQKKYDKRGDWKNYLGSGTSIKRAIETYGKSKFSKEIKGNIDHSGMPLVLKVALYLLALTGRKNRSSPLGEIRNLINLMQRLCILLLPFAFAS